MTIILIRYNKTYFNFDPFCLIFPQGQLGKSHSWGRRCHQSDNIDWGPKTANRIANSKITWNPWIYGAWLSIYKIVKFYIKNGSSYVIDVAAYMFWRPHLFICVRVHPEVIRKALESYMGGLGPLFALSLSHDCFLEIISKSWNISCLIHMWLKIQSNPFCMIALT